MSTWRTPQDDRPEKGCSSTECVLFFFSIFICFHLEGRVTEREGNLPSTGSLPTTATTARAGPAQSQRLRPGLLCRRGGPSIFPCFPLHASRGWSRSRAAKTRTSVHPGRWHPRCWLSFAAVLAPGPLILSCVYASLEGGPRRRDSLRNHTLWSQSPRVPGGMEASAVGTARGSGQELPVFPAHGLCSHFQVLLSSGWTEGEGRKMGEPAKEGEMG